MTERFMKLRQEYLKKTLSEDSIALSPFDQFDSWFNEAVETKILHPNAMTLATTTAQGSPDARIVLLKEVKENQFYFFTNYLSAKGRQLATNHNAALLFFWPDLERQVKLKGLVSKANEAVSDAYFATRPKGANLSAIASPQSEVVESRSWLERKQKETEEKYASKELTRPDNWGGYFFIPHEFEFWQGRENRLHDRIRYQKSKVDNTWKISRLAP